MGGCFAGGYDIQDSDSGLSDTIFRTQSSRQYSAKAGARSIESMTEMKSNDFSPTGYLVGLLGAGLASSSAPRRDLDGSNRSRRFLPLAATGETPSQRAVPG